MIIKKDTEMLLFRFSNYKSHSFIEEHVSVLRKAGYVWMLKLGKRSSIEKIEDIKEKGGWLVLRSPKAERSRSFLARFTKVVEGESADNTYPEYYDAFLDGAEEETLYYSSEPAYQWFKIESITPIDSKVAASLVVAKTGKKVDEVINTTRTAVMFIKNELPIEV